MRPDVLFVSSLPCDDVAAGLCMVDGSHGSRMVLEAERENSQSNPRIPASAPRRLGLLRVFRIWTQRAVCLAWYSVLLSALTRILPGFNALLLPFRRKDLFESAPWKQKIASIPIVSIIGIVWLVIIIPIDAVSYLQPILTSVLQTPSQELWNYSTSSGLTLVAVVILIGVALYFISKWYNKQRGIDVSLIFKTIPPE